MCTGRKIKITLCGQIPCKHYMSKYSPGQANLQFSLCDSQNQIWHFFLTNETAILVIVEVLNFYFWTKFHIKSVKKYPKLYFMTLKCYLKSNFTLLRGQNLQFWPSWETLIFFNLKVLKIIKIPKLQKQEIGLHRSVFLSRTYMI